MTKQHNKCGIYRKESQNFGRYAEVWLLVEQCMTCIPLELLQLVRRKGFEKTWCPFLCRVLTGSQRSRWRR